ncbi:MAG: hypothetical protein KAT28_04540 [Candidatus Aenigmarchaeota archaeon]|nr:hypothetical protein [Candidatus Aenigmarchaeota archaeon]
MIDKTISLKKSFDTIKPVLQEYVEEKEIIQNQIDSKGIIPKEICDNCKYKDILEVIKLDKKTNKSIPEFIEWITNNKIGKLMQCDKKKIYITSTKKQIENKNGVVLFGGSNSGSIGIQKSELIYKYEFPIIKFKNKSFRNIFEFEFDSFSFCKHITNKSSMKKILPVIKTKKTKRISLELLCEECYNRIDKIGCEQSILKRGFAYKSFKCNFTDILFKNLLRKHNICFIESEYEWYINSEYSEYHLPTLDMLVTKPTKNLKEVIKIIKPNTILSFGKKQNIVNFLKCNSNVIIFDDSEDIQQRFFIFDKNIKIEESIEKIVSHIISKLEEYSQEIGGKEHDKLINAFEKIAHDLGFVSQKEFFNKGSLVDLVWFDRKGKIFVATEVETSSQWKKDLVSTWETEPKLAIIVSHSKSDKSIKDITQYVLLKNIPHKLLFINNTTKKAYLIEKQKILKYYCMNTKKQIETTSNIFEY